MRAPLRLLALTLMLAASGAAHAQRAASPATPGAATGAYAGPTRPAEDVARDAARKPAEMVTFAGIAPGMKVADMIPGGGYFTRVFSVAIGPSGKVYALVPSIVVKSHPSALTGMQALAASPGYGNVVVIETGAGARPPEPLDVVWTAQNYHDLHNIPQPGAVAAFNKGVFAMLKPGGEYVVLDHAAQAGSGARDTGTLHRIDPATVRAEVVAAGFIYDGQSIAVRNTADDHTAKVFDPAVRGHTDQFIYKFRKPA